MFSVLACTAALFAVGALAREAGRAWIAAELSRATSYRVEIGAIGFGLRGLRATDLTVFGRPPFHGTALAHVTAARIELGSGSWRPRRIVLEDLDAALLGAPGVSNLFGHTTVAVRPEQPASNESPSMEILIERGRISAHWRQGQQGPRVAFRAQGMTAKGTPRGAFQAHLQQATLEVEGGPTFALPQLLVSREESPRALDRSGSVRLEAGDLAVVAPGAGAWLQHLRLSALVGADQARLSLESRADERARIRMAATIDGSAAALELAASDVPLSPLRPWLAPLGAQVSEGAHGDLALGLRVPADGSEIHATLRTAVSGVGVLHPSLDREPWSGLSAAITATARYLPSSGRVDLDAVRLEGFGLMVDVTGWLELAGSGLTRGRVAIRTPARQPSACTTLLGAQPEPIRAALRGLVLGGQLGLATTLSFDASNWEALALDLGVSPLCSVVREPDVIKGLLTVPAAQATVGTAAGPPGSKTERERVPLRLLPRHLIAAFVTAEDARFFTHPGFDVAMIGRALAHDLEVGAFAKGASTLTQQLAKNLFLTPERTLGRKLAEAVLAWRLEAHLSKDQILELYLNIVELGPGIHGVVQAAQAYFGKPASRLSPLESAHLAALTPNPLGLARRFRTGRVDESWLLRLYDLLATMKRSGRLTAAELHAARAAQLALRPI